MNCLTVLCTALILLGSGSKPVQEPAQAESARQAEQRGELAAAREAWLAAGVAAGPGAQREAFVANARLLDLRLVLRREIIEAFARDPKAFAELGLQGASDKGLKLADKDTPWVETKLELVQRAAAAAKPSQQARVGLVIEALARGNASEKEQALVQLGRLLEKKEAEAADAFTAVARARGEAVPARGYVFKNGQWAGADAAQASAQNAELEELAKRFELAPAAQREEQLKKLVALGPEARTRLGQALEARWTGALRTIDKSATLKELAQLAEQRKELDARRKSALDLIFDEETYFSPYKPPECPPEKAKLYPAVQQRVDELVARVREAWASTRKVHVPKSFADALGELEWNRARQRELELAFALPKELPEWLGGIDTSLDTIELASFAWSAQERAQLAQDRAVLAYVQRLCKSAGLDKASTPSAEEQSELKLTNDYRVMLGRCALAWNPKIQTAAQGHSEVMANTGKFSHSEDEPTRHTAAQRLRLAGYDFGIGENIALVDGAESAHTGWLHSSGHHRNILDAAHREIGVAVAGEYWTQDFGVGTEFLKELEPQARQ